MSLMDDTVEAIKITEAILVEHPDDFATQINLQSLQKRLESLRTDGAE